MPLYEYKCEACEQVFEVIQKFSDAPLEVHEGCGGRVERLISPPTFHFKGSGWYITDYARKSNGHSPAQKEQKESKSESQPAKTETKSESKPAAAPAKS
jgi:putative FmdB family regulatory protein